MLVLLFTMTVWLIFVLLVVTATAHNITFLDVPQYGDPRQEASLVCHYISDKDDPPLHSVKWYKGTNEIFRYTPEQQPSTRTFNSTAGLITKGTCNMTSCAIGVTLPRVYNTKLTFTCEVSTEGPRFAIVKQTKNLTVAVILKQDPVITEIPEVVQLGEEVLLNCSTQPAMPPANIAWYIDGEPEMTEPWMVNNTRVSSPNDLGLRSSWRSLRFRVTSSQGFLSLSCAATQPTFPPFTRTTHKSLDIARSPHLSMFTAAGLGSIISVDTLLMITSSILVRIMYIFISTTP